MKVKVSERLLIALHGPGAELPISHALQNELQKIAYQPLDLESYAAVKDQYKPRKKAISIRMDVDVLEWFQAQPGKYQQLINKACRIYMNIDCARLKKSEQQPDTV